ncbi:MAG: hypothetical protein LBE13_09970 [Bacteroidales bacterium]|jgi:hypothetical protein|nr:hypothetical protein [Bacteroidales bacterium]
MWSIQSKLLFIFLIAFFFILEGCGSYNRYQESDKLKIVFTALAKDNPNYGIFVLQNTNPLVSKIQIVKLIDADLGNEIPSSILKLTNRMIESGGWEFGVFQMSKIGTEKKLMLRVEYEQNGKRFFTTSPINSSGIWAKDLFVCEDLSALYLYFVPENSFSENDAVVSVNGEKASVSDISILPTTNGQSLVCLKIIPSQNLKSGERLFVRVTNDNETIYGGCTKVFYPFVAGQTQYSKVMRPVDLEYAKDSIGLNIYNEADFRKCPAVIEKIFIDGNDVTTQTVFPAEPFPPDLHNYDADVRQVLVKNINIKDGNLHRFDIDFKRLEPLRPAPTPEGYFDIQRFSFNVQDGVPYEIDLDDGLQGGACVLYAGLRPRPEITEIIRRCTSVYSANPSIPAYIYPHEGTKPAIVTQLAGCCDFIVTGQLNPLIPSTFGKSQKFFEHVRYMRNLPVSWASSVITDNDHLTSPKDLEWMTWGAIGAGSHGVFLTAPEKGNLEMAAECEKGAEQILRNIKLLKPLLGLTVPVELDYSCNQSGIHVDFLACGTDNILIVVLNEWSTRSTFQESEPFMAAIRKNIELDISLGEHFVPNFVLDLINGQLVSVAQKTQGNVKLTLPCFDNVQTILLSRKDIGKQTVLSSVTIPEPSLIFLQNPVVSLGTVRPDSEHSIEIPIQSCTNKNVTLTGTTISNSNSKAGEVVLSESVLNAGAKGFITLKYKASAQSGKSVTHIKYESPDLPEQEFPVYICAEIEHPAELSQTMVDFGLLLVGMKSTSKEIKLKSPDHSANISKVTADNEIVMEIVIAEDKKSFRFSAFSEQTGIFSSQLTVEITNQENETFTQTLRCTGQFQNTIFAVPPNVSVVMIDQPKKYTVGIQHISNKRIKITSILNSQFVKSHADLEKFDRNQSIELTILPEILETGKENVKIEGIIEGNEKFTLTVPVSVFSQRTTN